MFRCAEAAHKKTSKKLATMRLEKTKRGTNPGTGFCQCCYRLTMWKIGVKRFIALPKHTLRIQNIKKLKFLTF
ncbi:hypothetical protein BBN02_00400 [Vibrio parahaemolyticus]|nr:hypothetical protein FORC8_3993 [Vibrio parahaemolyticus]ODZ42003.1 hypothetical protein BBN02_00400 [Vibrio parahaemolyticus]